MFLLYRVILIVSEYIIVILHTINSFIAIHVALTMLSKIQLNGTIIRLFVIIFLEYTFAIIIINKLNGIENKIILLLGKKNILELYVINNKNLITFFNFDFSFKFSY